ncbi:MAG: hypothetical protein NTU85_03580 [Candidatus Kaiserbacteria bacterium]|nr:hypothetical protein [Candidatus Kaiserbacteria bacterium]
MKRYRRFVVTGPVRRGPDPAVQPSLLEPIKPVAAGELTIQERFELFHAANPQVYRVLREMALALAAQGQKRIGVKMLWEVLRYRFLVQAVPVGGDEFRLNNVFTSRYARWLDAEPGLQGRIELRQLKAE